MEDTQFNYILNLTDSDSLSTLTDLNLVTDNSIFTIDSYEVKDFNTSITLTDDLVNHPKHYTAHPSGVECIEITQHYNFCIGNAIKYLWRNGIKKDSKLEDKASQIQDLKKAIWYIEREISNIENSVYERN